MNETWKEIPGFDGRYQCSILGRIRSTDWRDTRGYLRKGKILKQVHERNGYLQVPLTTVKSKLYLAHRLIALTFLQGIPGKDFVNHKNGVKDDNRLDNLEWCTKSENSKHSFLINMQCNKGEKHPSHKLTEPQVLAIRSIYNKGNTTSRQLAKIFQLSKTQVLDIVNKKSWSHI